MSLFNRIFAFLSYSVCFAVVAAAESPAAKVQQGRLADGRAFRTDAEGYRLVDYIAELEVKNEELKRQVVGLENMLDEKDGIPSPNSFKTSDKQSPVCPTDIKSLSVELQATKKEVALKNEELEILSAKLKQRSAPKDCDYSAVQTPLKAQIDILERELTATRTSLQNKTSDLLAAEAEVNDSKRNRNQVAQSQSALEQELTAAREEIRTLQAAVQIAQQDASIREEHARALLKSSTSTAEAEPAVLKVESAPMTVRSTEPEPDSPANTLGERELAEAKKDFTEMLGKIQKQIGRRKDLIDSLKQRKHQVSIDVKPLVTKDGTSLDQIRNEVKQLSLSTNISALQIKLREIEAALAEDIAVMERLSKL